VTAAARSIERLAWDSEHFGVSIGRVRVDAGADPEAVAHAADEARLDCVYLLVPAADAASLARAQHAGFRVIVLRAELERPIGTEADPGEVRRVRAADEPWLMRLASTAFADARFAADPRFDRERVAALYRRWVARGLESADRIVLVAPPDHGFVIAGLDHARGVGDIELIAVGREMAGAGVGRRLLRAAHALFAESGLSRAVVTTQAGNVAAMRLYEQAGYRTTAMAYWLHRWRDQGSPGSTV
jgi:dTDP-4-amino-4,6-dideoxy-D-galactose acyltransferase